MVTNQSNRPDFYLSSAEHRGDWAKPRAAYVERVIRDRQGVAHLWIRLDPPAQNAGATVERVVVGPHFEGSSLWPNRRFPVPVYLYLPKAGKRPTDEVFEPADYDLVAWGELYEERRDAERVATGQGE